MLKFHVANIVGPIVFEFLNFLTVIFVSFCVQFNFTSQNRATRDFGSIWAIRLPACPPVSPSS